MTRILTAAGMRAAERAAIDAGLVTGRQLMERAGEGVVAAIMAEWPGLAAEPQRALVLCGPGNNGGDGFVVARLLQEMGWTVEAFFLGDPDRLSPDARANFDLWAELGPIRYFDTIALLAALDRAAAAGTRRWLVIDALFGIGQRGRLDAVLAPLDDLIHAAAALADGPELVFVAVDIPTGLDADTGERLAERPFPADLIVTFHARKPVHGTAAIGKAAVVVADIGL